MGLLCTQQALYVYNHVNYDSWHLSSTFSDLRTINLGINPLNRRLPPPHLPTGLPVMSYQNNDVAHDQQTHHNWRPLLCRCCCCRSHSPAWDTRAGMRPGRGWERRAAGTGPFYRRGGTSLAVQWLGLCAPTTGDVGSIPGWGSKILQAMERAPQKRNQGWDGAVTDQSSGLASTAPPPHPDPQGPLFTFFACSFSGQPLPQWLPIYAQAPP